MAVTAVLETLDDVPETLRPEYKELDIPNVGKRFVLDVTGIDTHPTVRSLKVAHDSVKAKRDQLKTELDAANVKVGNLPEDFDPEEYARLKQDVADGKGPKVDERLEQQRKDLGKKHETEVARLNTEIQTREQRVGFLEGTVRKSTVDDGLTKALVDAGVTKEYLGAARALLKEKGLIKLVEENGVFSAIAETDTLGPVPIDRFVQDWANGDEGKPFIPKPTGGGAQGGSGRSFGDNPFSAEKWNVTQQGQVVREKGMEHAGRLAAAAGTTVGGPKPAPRPSAA